MEAKQEIMQIVNTLPSDVLDNLLQYLRQIEKTSKDKLQLAVNLRTILNEDKELLQKLAK